MDILEEGKVAVIEDVTFPAIKAPLWIVILSSIPPKINQILFYVTFTNLTYGYHLKRDVLLILLSDIESFNNCNGYKLAETGLNMHMLHILKD